MMKQFIIIIFLLGYAMTSSAQVANDYVLLPGATHLLPTGEHLKLIIQWHDIDGTPHEGISAFLKTQTPEWFINGKPLTNQDAGEGNLSVDLTLENAVYTAPATIPKTNPVNISVRFHPTDTSKLIVTLVCNITVIDPGNKWYVAFTYTSFDTQSDISTNELHTNTTHTTANASMLIKGAPAEADGHTSINTDYDTIVTYNNSGNWSQQTLDVSKDINGNIEEKTERNYNGSVTKDQRGIEFEYDPSPGGIKELAAAGLSFSKIGKEQFWKRNDNNALVSTTETVNEPSGKDILLGSNKDVVKKTKDGFTIDGHVQQDTSYTDVTGVKHTAHATTIYHVIISRKASKKDNTYISNNKAEMIKKQLAKFV
jgi:hypothetical protein